MHCWAPPARLVTALLGKPHGMAAQEAVSVSAFSIIAVQARV